jgi:hypothetical protein
VARRKCAGGRNIERIDGRADGTEQEKREPESLSELYHWGEGGSHKMQCVVCPTIDGGDRRSRRKRHGAIILLTDLGVHLVRVWKIPGDFDTDRGGDSAAPRLEE